MAAAASAALSGSPRRDAVEVRQPERVRELVAQHLLQTPAHEVGQLVACSRRVEHAGLAITKDGAPLVASEYVGDLLLCPLEVASIQTVVHDAADLRCGQEQEDLSLGLAAALVARQRLQELPPRLDAVRVDEGEGRCPVAVRQLRQRRGKGLVDVAGVNLNVAAGRQRLVGGLEAVGSVRPKFETTEDRERRICLQRTKEAALDWESGVLIDVRGLTGEQIKVNRRARSLAGHCERLQVGREHVELALGPEPPRPLRHA